MALVFSNFSFRDAALGAAVCKRFAALVGSAQLLAARGASNYALRDDRGLMHSFATRFGTRGWRRASETTMHQRAGRRVPPPAVVVKWTTLGATGRGFWWGSSDSDEEDEPEGFARILIAEPSPEDRSEFGFCCAHDCMVDPGSFAEVCLPCDLLCTRFRLAIGRCMAPDFVGWQFEAWDTATGSWNCVFDPEGRAF